MNMDDIHSCHPWCDRPLCVAVRKAVEAEREACAKVFERMWELGAGPIECAAAIRARGEKP